MAKDVHINTSNLQIDKTLVRQQHLSVYLLSREVGRSQIWVARRISELKQSGVWNVLEAQLIANKRFLELYYDGLDLPHTINVNAFEVSSAARVLQTKSVERDKSKSAVVV